MNHRWFGILAAIVQVLAFPQTGQTPEAARTERGPYARIAILRPHEGDTVDFEAGYIRHLEWHRQAKDPWTWFGWTIWAGDRQRWFVYATFGHSPAALDSPVDPVNDERDSLLNVIPHAEFAGSTLYEFLPEFSRGTGEPQATPRVELMTVDLNPGAAKAFETALSGAQSSLQGETLWYRLMAGGTHPRYVRFRPKASLSALLEDRREDPLPEAVDRLVAKVTVEILTLRPTMSYGIQPSRP